MQAETDGLWWYTDQRVDHALSVGATGSGVRVAVIDDTLSPDLNMFSDATISIHEPSFCNRIDGSPIPATERTLSPGSHHGTNIVAMLVGNGKGVDGRVAPKGVAQRTDLWFYSANCAYYYSQDTHAYSRDPVAHAIVQAVDDGARIVLISVAPVLPDPVVRESVAYALREGVIIITRHADQQSNLDWLSGLNGVLTVQGTGPDGQVPAPGTTGIWPSRGKITVTAPGAHLLLQGDRSEHSWLPTTIGHGTSYAAALVAGMLASVASQHPEATNAQLIHSLIENTRTEGREPGYSPADGYGQASLPNMVRVNPTQYPDVNPLIVPDDGLEPGLTAEDIADAPRPAWAGPAPTSIPTAPPTPSHTATSVPEPVEPDGVPVWVIVGVLLLTVATAVVVVVALRATRDELTRSSR
ncbi:MAG: S8/S53 family peptidase [Micrococcales bacterium]|nr:S8/S53 family peptidase [Micrococcales bacterium]